MPQLFEHPKFAGVRGTSWIMAFSMLLATSAMLPAQTAQRGTASPAANTNPNTPEMEPLAMQALKSASQQLQRAPSFSFTARIMREEPGTNGQMLDFFRRIDVQVQRPNKMRVDVKSDTSDSCLWYDGKNVTMMPESAKIYTTLPAPATLDGTLNMLREKMQVHMPLIPFLSSNPYQHFSDGLEGAHEIGVTYNGNEQLLHLAFTEADADWQLWLTGPNQVLPKRLSIIYKKIEGQPRVNVEFSNWNLSPEIPSSAFVFEKPQGARQVSFDAIQHRRKTQQGGEQ